MAAEEAVGRTLARVGAVAGWVVAAHLLAPGGGRAQEASDHADAPVVRATRVTAPVGVDGRLDEEAWARAEPVPASRSGTPRRARR